MDQFDALYDIRAAQRLAEESVDPIAEVDTPEAMAIRRVLQSIANSLLALAKIEYAKLQRRSDLT